MRARHVNMMLLALLAGCTPPKPTAFYASPALPAAAPGSLISTAPYAPTVPGAAAYRVLYNSTDENGHIVPVSGVVYIPTAPPPPGGRNTVAWAHATSGIAQGCAPSLDQGGLGGFTLAGSIPGLSTFISAGDIVAATDYEGLGAPGVHPYLIGKAEGQDIIDSVRAAGGLPGAALNGNYVVWGHSQGGQAALFAGQIAAAYAPELHLLGVAAAAPPTDLYHELTEPYTGDSGRLFGAYVYQTWSETYHFPITTVVDPRAVPQVAVVATKCLGSLGQAIGALHAAGALDPVFMAHPPATTPPWPALYERNTPGHAPSGAPLLIVQGTKDTTVEPHYAETYTAKLCAAHEIIDYQEFKNTTHLQIADRALPTITPWIAARFAGKKAPDICGK